MGYIGQETVVGGKKGGEEKHEDEGDGLYGHKVVGSNCGNIGREMCDELYGHEC